MENEAMARELESLLAMNAGLLLVVGALMRTHPNHDAMQLDLTAVLERQLASASGPCSKLSEKQRDQVRDLVEWLGAVRSSL